MLFFYGCYDEISENYFILNDIPLTVLLYALLVKYIHCIQTLYKPHLDDLILL